MGWFKDTWNTGITWNDDGLKDIVKYNPVSQLGSWASDTFDDLSGKTAAEIQAKSAQDAAAVEAAAADAGIAETRRQFDAMQTILSPYVQAGNKSLTQQQDLMGANGPEAQAAAIAAINSSPEMLAMTQQGEDAILQQGSATGGLRGGNVQGALAQFRPQALSSLINQQYSRLGGITQMGQASAAGVGAAGMQAGQSIAGLYGQQGAATAGGILGAGQAESTIGYNQAATGLQLASMLYGGF